MNGLNGGGTKGMFMGRVVLAALLGKVAEDDAVWGGGWAAPESTLC